MKLNLKSMVKKHFLLLILLLMVLISHYFLLKDGVIPFQFDHGKDSLAVMEMWLSKSPKLIGPWTSIPGLYFGPAWYYLILPAFLLGAWNPLAPVLLMVGLLLLQVYLAYRYLGKEEALMMSTAPTWLMISTSAWNPFPMTLVSLVILILLKKIKAQGSANWQQLFLLAFSASMGCHFSTAFAILFPILIMLSLWRQKIKINLKQLAIMAMAYVLPFLPQIAFELRHNFMEVRAVLNYLQTGGGQAFTLTKIAFLAQNFWSQLKSSAWPDFYFPELSILNQIVAIYSVILILVGLSNWRQGKSQQQSLFSLGFEYLSWLVLPFIAYTFLHFNVWYILALSPLMAMIMADLLRHLKPAWRFSFMFLLCLSLFVKVLYFNFTDKANLAQYSNFLPAKLEAIDIIRKDAAGATFNSYHYAPDVYDFSYQYLYFQQALQGKKLPHDFSYRPGVIDYVVEKPALLDYFTLQQSQDLARYNYYIVEPPAVPSYLEEWWSHIGINPDSLTVIPSRSRLLIYRQNLEYENAN